jgi:hypothetical protein
MVRVYFLIRVEPLRSKAMERNKRYILMEIEGQRKNLSQGMMVLYLWLEECASPLERRKMETSSAIIFFSQGVQSGARYVNLSLTRAVVRMSWRTKW